MNPATLRQEIAIHERLKEQLRAVYGDIDDETLLTTLEGETNVVEIIAATYRQAKTNEALAEGLKGLIEQMQARKKRLEQSAETLKAWTLRAMQETGRDRIPAPDFTLSIAKAGPKVIITDEALIPAEYRHEPKTPEPDKAAIKKALEDGKTVPGATLSNGGVRLNPRAN